MGFRIYRKLKTRLSRFNPDDFWHKKGKEYYFNEKKSNHTKEYDGPLVEFLKTIQFDSVLEFGCGYGRVTKLINDNFKVKKYTAFDISPEQINHAVSYCKEYPVKFSTNSVQNFKTDEKFDLVIGVKVLQHILPNEIHSVIERLKSYSTKYFVNMDSDYTLTPKVKAPHVFYHNYPKLLDAKITPLGNNNIIYQTTMF